MGKCIKKIIGNRIKNLRESKGLSQRELSQKIGLKGNKSISDIENGNSNFTINKLKHISNALEISISDLIDDKNNLYSKIREVKRKYPQIPNSFLRIFNSCYKEGIRFNGDLSIYYYLWIILNALNNRVD